MLLKGGHLKNKMIFDILATKKEIKIFKKEKLKQKYTWNRLYFIKLQSQHAYHQKKI